MTTARTLFLAGLGWRIGRCRRDERIGRHHARRCVAVEHQDVRELRDVGSDPVAADGRQIRQQRLEAMHGTAVGRALVGNVVRPAEPLHLELFARGEGLAGDRELAGDDLEVAPEMTLDLITVQVVYPGAAPEEVEEAARLAASYVAVGLRLLDPDAAVPAWAAAGAPVPALALLMLTPVHRATSQQDLRQLLGKQDAGFDLERS